MYKQSTINPEATLCYRTLSLYKLFIRLVVGRPARQLQQVTIRMIYPVAGAKFHDPLFLSFLHLPLFNFQLTLPEMFPSRQYIIEIYSTRHSIRNEARVTLISCPRSPKLLRLEIG